MSSDIQNDEFLLPGNLGTVKVGDTIKSISKMETNKKEGSITLTIVDEMKPLKDYLQGNSSTQEFIQECRNISKTENAEFEIIEPKKLTE